MNTSEKLQVDDDIGEVDTKKYKSMVGNLIYLSHTRHGVSYLVCVVSKYMNRLTMHHYGAMKRIIKYIVGTLDFGIRFSHTYELKLIVFH